MGVLSWGSRYVCTILVWAWLVVCFFIHLYGSLCVEGLCLTRLDLVITSNNTIVVLLTTYPLYPLPQMNGRHCAATTLDRFLRNAELYGLLGSEHEGLTACLPQCAGVLVFSVQGQPS